MWVPSPPPPPTPRLLWHFFFFLIVCFTSYFVFSIAVLQHSLGVVYYHLLLRRETRIPGVAPFSFRIGIWDLFRHRGQKSYTPTAFGKLWIVREWSSIPGGGGLHNGRGWGGGGQVTFYPYKRGCGESFSHPEGGHKKF